MLSENWTVAAFKRHLHPGSVPLSPDHDRTHDLEHSPTEEISCTSHAVSLFPQHTHIHTHIYMHTNMRRNRKKPPGYGHTYTRGETIRQCCQIVKPETGVPMNEIAVRKKCTGTCTHTHKEKKNNSSNIWEQGTRRGNVDHHLQHFRDSGAIWEGLQTLDPHDGCQ